MGFEQGSRIVYIGGQTKSDISKGYGLSTNTIYTVKKVGWGYVSAYPQRLCLVLEERPGEIHAAILFREIRLLPITGETERWSPEDRARQKFVRAHNESIMEMIRRIG